MSSTNQGVSDSNNKYKKEPFYNLLLNMFIWGPKDEQDNQNLWNAVKYQVCNGFGESNEKQTQEAENFLKNSQGEVVKTWNNLWSKKESLSLT